MSDESSCSLGHTVEHVGNVRYILMIIMTHIKGCASWKMKFWKGLKTLKNHNFRPKNVIFGRF